MKAAWNLEGIRHETLPMAKAHLAKLGRSVAQFQAIVAVARNPYELEVSRFYYLRKGHSFDRSPAQDLALAGDFCAFAAGSRWWFKELADFYTLDGKKPDNLHILRFEHLTADFDAVCSPFLDHPTTLRRLNSTEHGVFKDYLTPQVEEAIFHKYRWLFEAGFYPRYRF